MLGAEPPKLNADPRSSVDRYGAVSNAWEWGIESSDALADGAGNVVGFLTTYVLPIEDQVFMIAHSMGPLVEPIVRLVRDPSSGDQAARLVAEHLPNLWSGLRDGAGMPTGQGLIKARTNQDHWLFGGLLLSRSTTSVDVDPAAVNAVRDKAFVIFGEALGFPGNLPGILDVLPPDRRRQQLEQAASLFDDLADIIDKVSSVMR
jgi:hypothetical protein